MGGVGGAGGNISGGKGGNDTHTDFASDGATGGPGGGGGGAGEALTTIHDMGSGGDGGKFGGGGGAVIYGTAGNGGEFGGGGGAGSNAASLGRVIGNGGFGGGGGGGGAGGPNGPGNGGGNGGFGGGGGGTAGSPAVSSAYGASGGTFGNGAGGGGGAALGGAIFVRGSNGASLTIANGSVDAGTIAGGAGGTNAPGSGSGGSSGNALGSSMFLQGGTTTFQVGTNGQQIIYGSIVDDSLTGQSAGVIKTGSGTLIMEGTNTYTGGTTISGGTLYVGVNGTTGAITGDITNNGVLLLDRSDNLTLAGAITGSGSLAQVGGGTLTLSHGGLGYKGNTTAAAGTLIVYNSSVPGANIFIGGGATLQYSNTGNSTVAQPATTYTGGGTLIKNGGNFLVFGSAGTVNVNLSAGAVVDVEGGTLNGSSNYQGNWTANQAALNIAGGAVYDAVEGGTTFTQQFDALTGAGTLRGGFSGNPNGITTLTFGVANGSGTFSGAITDGASGHLAIVKTGSGLEAFSGADTAAGGTTVAAGTLQIGSGGGGGSISGNVNIASNATLTFVRSGSLTVGGSISGAGALVQSGPGNLTLSGTNTYGGGTLVTGGNITAESNFGPGPLTLNGGGLIATTSAVLFKNISFINGRIDTQAFTSTYSGTLSGTGSFTKLGGGTLAISNSQTLPGGVSVSAGTLQIGNGATSGSLNANVVDNGAISFNRSDNTSYTGVISGGGSLVKSGAGILTLTSTQTYTGATNIAGGTLRLGTLATGSPPAGFAAYYSFDNVSGSTVINGGSSGSNANATIGGSGAIVAGGLHGNALSYATSTAVLNPNSPIAVPNRATVSAWFNGLTAPNSLRTLFANASGDSLAELLNTSGYALGDIINGGQHNIGVDLASYATGWHQLTVVEDFGPFNQVFYLDGQPIATVSNAFTTRAINSFGNIAAGGHPFAQKLDDIYVYNNLALTPAQVQQLYLANPTLMLLSSSTPVALSGGGTLDLNGNNQAVPSLNGDASTSILLGSGTLTTGSDNSDSIFAGVISGSGSLVKVGAGTLYLSGTNTYTGGTTISSGTLQLSYSLPSGSVVGNIVDNSMLTIRRADVYAFAGNISGSGTITKFGGNPLIFGGAGPAGVSMSAGALVDVEAGAIVGSGAYQGNWTANLASLNIAGGATFDAVEGGATFIEQFDALSGGGVLRGGYFNNPGGITTVILGAANGSGTFAGTIGDDSSAHLAIRKTGTGIQTLTGANTYTGGTTITGGTLQIGNGGTTGSITGDVTDNAQLSFKRTDNFTFAGNITGTGAITQAGTGILTLNNIRMPAATIAAGTITIVPNGSTGGVSTLNTLSIAGTFAAPTARLNLTNNDLILPTAPIAQGNLRLLIKAGYNAGAWNGNGIIADAALTTAQGALGYGIAGDVGLTTLDGQALSTTAEIVKFTYFGDSSLDGKVDLGNDFTLFLQGYLKAGSTWELGDYNYDGTVNAADFGMFVDGYKLQGGALGTLDEVIAGSPALSAAQKASLLAAVPEPSVVGIAGIAMVGALLRRRRKIQAEN